MSAAGRRRRNDDRLLRPTTRSRTHARVGRGKCPDEGRMQMERGPLLGRLASVGSVQLLQVEARLNIGQQQQQPSLGDRRDRGLLIKSQR